MIVICFGGSHVCLVSGKPAEGAWVWSAGGSHLGVSWNQEVSVTGDNRQDYERSYHLLPILSHTGLSYKRGGMAGGVTRA